MRLSQAGKGSRLARRAKRAGHRQRLRDSRRLNQNIVKPSLLDETVELGETIVAQRAADAPVGHLDQLLLGPREIGPAILDEVDVDVHIAHIVDDNGDPAAFPVVQNMVPQFRFAGSEKA